MPSIVDNLSVRKVCVDDFAIRKRFSYGTVMVDLETHRIIDMIPSRDTRDVKKWLDLYPNIEIISRDGAQIYAVAGHNSHPGAIQVSDRFHLIKGLSEAIDKYVIRAFPPMIEIPAVTIQTEEMKQLLNVNNKVKRIRFAHEKKKAGMTANEIALMLHATPKTIEKYLNLDPDKETDRIIIKEQNHQHAIEQKQKEVDSVRSLAREGVPIEQIAKMTHHTYKTVQNYLNPDYSVVDGHYNVRIPNKLAPFEKDVIELRSKGMTYVKIHEIITRRGYNGTVASLRMFMQKERIRNANKEDEYMINSDYQPTEMVQRKALSQLIYKKIEDVFIINPDQYKKVLETYPVLGNLYAAIKEFHEIIYSRHSDRLEQWLNKLEKFDIPELQTYVNGVKKDIEAVKNGIAFAYNNGVAEGSVNKIKVIKRIMYGRNSFELLKAKVLLHEQFCFNNN